MTATTNQIRVSKLCSIVNTLSPKLVKILGMSLQTKLTQAILRNGQFSLWFIFVYVSF